MNTTQLYPSSNEESIKIRKDNSKKSFSNIYNLTLQLCSISKHEVQCSKGILKCWKDIIAIWDKHMMPLSSFDIFYAALYHITWQKYESLINDVKIKELLILVEQELLTDGYAFDAWRTCPEFREAFNKILFSINYDQNSHCSCCSEAFSRYLYARTFSKVIYKDCIPEQIMLYSNPYQKRSFHTSSCLNYCYHFFELAILRLLPEADAWTNEWCDEKHIMCCLNNRYNIDYSLNCREFDTLVFTIIKIICNNTYCDSLIRIKNFPLTIAEAIWGDNAEKQIQRCFSTVYSRHKAYTQKSHTRRTLTRYSREAILNSGLYNLLDSWRTSNDPRLTQQTKKKMFEFMMGN